MKLKMSALVDGASGRDGTLVIRRGKGGYIAISRAPSNPSRSQGQSEVRDNLGEAAREFPKLTDEQIAAWKAYGAGQTRKNTVGGGTYAQSGFNAYVELTTVFKLASPGAASPVLPPAEAFAGDTLELTLTNDTGAIIVAGSGPTSTGTVLEISTVELKSRARAIPRTGYKVRGYFTLNQANNYLANVPVGPGIHAVEVRYVNKATGQATLPKLLGKTTVLTLEVGGADASGRVDRETGEVLAPGKRGAMKKAA